MGSFRTIRAFHRGAGAVVHAVEGSVRLVVLVALSWLSCAAFAGTVHYRSHDGTHEATVITGGPKDAEESVVIIKDRRGKVLSKRSYTSHDGQHGYGVQSAAWSGDSKFFLYSLSSSGGHQAGRFPTYFYSRKDRRTRALDRYVGPVVSPQFELYMPDIVVVSVEDKNGEADRLKVPMHKLQLGKR